MLVPQELVDLIVGNLEGDTPALKSCSLAARTFVRASQTYLFQRIEILPPTQPQKSGDTPCQRLYKVLTISPHLPAHVAELRVVVVGSETSFDYDGNWEYTGKRQTPWVMSNRTLSLVLPLLNLKRFSMVENSPRDWSQGGRYSMNWGKLGRFSKSALITVFSSPKLESVHLRGLVIHSPRELLSLFRDASSLTSLSLSRIYYDRPSDNLECLDSKPWHPRLTSLLLSEIHSDMLICHFLNPRIDLSRVTSLTISTNSVKWRTKMIEATVFNCIENIGVIQTLSMDTVFPSLITSHLRSLLLFSDKMYTIMLHVFKTFPYYPQGSRLEAITFDTFPAKLGAATELNHAIDAAMARLPCLKTVEIKIFPDDRSFSEWAAALRASLPSLEGRGLLIITEVKHGDPIIGWE